MQLAGFGGIKALLGVAQAEEVDVGHLRPVCADDAEQLPCSDHPSFAIPRRDLELL